MHVFPGVFSNCKCCLFHETTLVDRIDHQAWSPKLARPSFWGVDDANAVRLEIGEDDEGSFHERENNMTTCIAEGSIKLDLMQRQC